MSYYYYYYIGYQKDGKIYPWGPYTADGKLKPVLSKSRSFASDLYKFFYSFDKSAASDELKKEFACCFEPDNKYFSLHYLPVNQLPTGSAIRRGYFLIEDVEAYEEMLASGEIDYLFDGFYDKMSPVTFAARIVNDVMGGYKKDPEDEEGRRPASDYMYYAYVDYKSVEYEANFITSICEALTDYGVLPEGAKPVIIEDEG